MVKNIFIIVLLLLIGFMGYVAVDVYLSPDEYKVQDQAVIIPQKIKQRVKVEMYSLTTCTYCVQAKKFLEQKGINVIEYNVADALHSAEMMKRTHNARSVPQIFIGNKLIGGYGALMRLDREGKLALLLEGHSVDD